MSNRRYEIEDTHKTSIILDMSVYKKVLELSEEEDRSVSAQINKILKEYFRSKEK